MFGEVLLAMGIGWAIRFFTEPEVICTKNMFEPDISLLKAYHPRDCYEEANNTKCPSKYDTSWKLVPVDYDKLGGKYGELQTELKNCVDSITSTNENLRIER